MPARGTPPTDLSMWARKSTRSVPHGHTVYRIEGVADCDAFQRVVDVHDHAIIRRQHVKALERGLCAAQLGVGVVPAPALVGVQPGVRPVKARQSARQVIDVAIAVSGERGLWPSRSSPQSACHSRRRSPQPRRPRGARSAQRAVRRRAKRPSYRRCGSGRSPARTPGGPPRSRRRGHGWLSPGRTRSRVCARGRN